MAYLWDINKFIATETVLKHHSIASLKYDGIDDLQKLLSEGLCKKPMRDHFQKLLHENECSVEGLIDWKSLPISPYHNLQCEISDWTHRPCQVFVTDVERSFLDEGRGVDPSWDFFLFHKGLAMGPVNTHFHVPIMGLLTDSDGDRKSVV